MVLERMGEWVKVRLSKGDLNQVKDMYALEAEQVIKAEKRDSVRFRGWLMVKTNNYARHLKSCSTSFLACIMLILDVDLLFINRSIDVLRKIFQNKITMFSHTSSTSTNSFPCAIYTFRQ